MNEKLKQEIELKDDNDDFVYPGKISIEDDKIIKQIVEVLSHERFDHRGWSECGYYKFCASYFILKMMREMKETNDN